MGWNWVRGGSLAGVLLAGLALPHAALAQRGTAGPIYQPNLDALIDGGEDWLAGLEAKGWFLRGQATGVIQGKPAFRSPYQGDASLSPNGETRNTQSIDLVVGRRLWENAEIVAVPTVTRGFGLTNSLGVASFPNGEAFRLGTRDPVVWLSRLFIRQTVDLSYDAAGSDPDPMRFTGPLALERLTFTLGKVSVWDFFDDNRYAHDGRTQFMQWGLVGAGAFDFAADARGFTEGGVAEWENGTWAVRTGLFRVAREANGLDLEPRYLKGLQGLTQVERAWLANGRPGVLRLLGGWSHPRSARWGDLTQAVVAGQADTANLRAFRTKAMVALNLEQEMTDDFGIFARLAWNNGREQNWMYTEMDWSVSGGVSVNGLRWNRPLDTIGVGFNLGGLSTDHQRFLEAGGVGFITGDGRLNYAPELVAETYYDMRLAPGLNLALDAQLVVNPAYNQDRGPVPVFAMRIHAAF